MSAIFDTTKLAASADTTKLELIPSTDYSAQGTQKVDLEASRVERIFVKNLVQTDRPKSVSNYADGPELRLYDYLRVVETYRLKGKFTKDRSGNTAASWATAKQKMDDCMTIFEGGGTFCFNWRGTYYEVMIKEPVFVVEKPENVIEFTIDLMNGKGPKTP